MAIELPLEQSKTFFRAAATTVTTTTLYTVGATLKARVKNIVVTNTAATAATFTLTLGGIDLATAVSIAANSFLTWDLDQELDAGKIIAGGASAITVNFHISGTETI